MADIRTTRAMLEEVVERNLRILDAGNDAAIAQMAETMRDLREQLTAALEIGRTLEENVNRVKNTNHDRMR